MSFKGCRATKESIKYDIAFLNKMKDVLNGNNPDDVEMMIDQWIVDLNKELTK